MPFNNSEDTFDIFEYLSLLKNAGGRGGGEGKGKEKKER